MLINNFIYFNNPFKTYNKIKKYFKPLKGFFYCGKTNNVPMLYWSSKYFIWANDVCWKDKYDSPRFEDSPCFFINLFGYSIGWTWVPKGFESIDAINYWEQALWYLHYCPDIEKAKDNWPWKWEGKSTWDDKYLK